NGGFQPQSKPPVHTGGFDLYIECQKAGNRKDLLFYLGKYPENIRIKVDYSLEDLSEVSIIQTKQKKFNY
uniref:hypothetical protein n=1 Tax=Enterococcus gilvus TaxID=160453 RepID=UPI0028D6D02D